MMLATADLRACRMSTGFTLLEMAIVLAIFGVLLSSLLQPLGARLDTQKRAETAAQLQAVLKATVGYLHLNRRLPCPASLESDGWALDECVGIKASGFVPTATLGLQGPRDVEGVLLDSWGRRIRYVTSGSDHPSRGQQALPDYTGVGEIDQVGLPWLRSELLICTHGNGLDCPRDSVRANQVPVLVFSTGSNLQQSTDQDENLDLDNRFVMRDPTDHTANVFDDIVVWMSENEFIYEWIHSID